MGPRHEQSGQGMTERRKHKRVPYGAWVEDLTQVGTIQFYMAKDLSVGGLLLTAPEPPPLGNKVHLRLVVENEARVMAVDGRVIRHTTLDGTKAFAVSFINLDAARQQFLEDLVMEHTTVADEGEPEKP